MELSPFMYNVFTRMDLGNMYPKNKKQNKTVIEYNQRIGRAREKVKDDEYITASNLRSKRYNLPESSKKLTKKELKEAGEKPTSENVTEVSTPSTAIGKMRYNPKTGSLYVTFRSNKNKEYLFPHVGKAVVQNFLTAGSKGRYYWNRVRPYAVSKAEAIQLKMERGNK